VRHCPALCSCCVHDLRSTIPTCSNHSTFALPPPTKSPTPCPSRCATGAGSGFHDADDVMARITAERLVRHLDASGFVLMKKPPAAECRR
jgi:hypothetical protein